MNVGRSERNITAKVLGVVFAIVLWFIVTTNAVFTHQVELPIQYAGPDEGYMVTGERPDHVVAAIEGSGNSLVSFCASRLIRSEQRYALVDLTAMEKGSHTVTIEPGDINLADDSDIRVTGIEYPGDATFALYIDRIISRSVPVRTDSLGYSAAPGILLLADPVAEPPSVALSGAQEVVSRVRYVRPERDDDLTLTPADSVLTLDVATPEYTTAEPPGVTLHFTFDQVMTRRLHGVPVRPRNFPRLISVKPDSLIADIRGAASVVSALDRTSLRIEIPYGEYRAQLAAGDSLVEPVVLLPEGVIEAGLIPPEVRLTGGP